MDGHFSALLGVATIRYRLLRTMRRLGLVWGLISVAGTIWLAAAWAVPEIRPYSLPVIGLLVAGGIVAALTLWFLPVPPREAARLLDREYGLPDSALSTDELASAGIRTSWKESQMADTLEKIQGVRPLRSEPGLRRGISTLALFGAIAAGTLLLPLPPQAETLAASQAQDLRDLFDDWEKAQEMQPDPQLEEVLKELVPLREKLERDEMTSRDLLVQLSKIEDRLEKYQQQLQASSLDPFAASLAEALNQAGDMEAVAAALDEKDYERARDAAEALKKNMAASQSPLSSGLAKPGAQKKLADLAGQLGANGQKTMANALQGMSQAAKNSDRKKMCDSLGGMCSALSQQIAKDSQRKNLSLQCRQIGLCKQCMGDGSSMCMSLSLLPKLSLAMSNKPSKSAGSATNPIRYGAPTQAEAPVRQEALSGAADAQGESETTTMSSPDAPRQQTISVANADLAQYQKLSEQAIEDESLPLARRRTIRRYFELIRSDGGATQNP